ARRARARSRCRSSHQARRHRHRRQQRRRPRLRLRLRVRLRVRLHRGEPKGTRTGQVTSVDQLARSLEDARGRQRPIARKRVGGRGWLMRRLLVAADVVGLGAAFAVAELVFGNRGPDPVSLRQEIVFFIGGLPIFVLGAKLFGLYDRDEARAAHSTPDDLVRVFLLMTVGVFVVEHAVDLTAAASPDLVKLSAFWAAAILGVTAARIAVRTLARSSTLFVQSSVVVGAGEIGQLIARKLLRHREY